MSKKLEDFIRNHRDEFDTWEPHPQAWHHIAQRTFGRGRGRIARTRWITWSAAAILIVTLSVFLVRTIPVQKPGAGIRGMQETESTVPDVYTGQLLQFSKQVERKEEELRRLGADYPDLYRGFTEDINKMDSAYEEMKKMLTDNPDREVLLQSMIDNLQLQLDLLNQQVQIMQQIKKSKKDNHEKKNVTI